MREIGILMSAPMVRSTLDDTKLQTRRGMRPQPFLDNKGLLWWHWSKSRGSARNEPPGQPSDEWLEHCPYGRPGDRLWVREAWRSGKIADRFPPRELTPHVVWYEADGTAPEATSGKLRPGMFMPRWASRITLEVTGVRVERLQDISEADAKAEGAGPLLVPPDGGSCPHVEGYRVLWESINGAGSWDANPWVWCVSFRRLEAQC
jgi:hypothetical protein